MELFIAAIVGMVIHYAIMTAAVKDGTDKSYRQLTAQTQLLFAIARRQGVAEDELTAITDTLPPPRRARVTEHSKPG